MQKISPAGRVPFRSALIGCALLALAVFVPTIVEAVPITFTLDNPNQSVMAPSSGFLTVDYTGTVVIDPSYKMSAGSIDPAFEATLTNHLDGFFTSAFLIFLNGGTGTYTGSIFDINVPAGTPIDLYSFNSLGSSAMVSLGVDFTGKRGAGGPPTTASEAFSVKVIGGNPVPDSGSTMLLLGLSVVGLCVGRRIVA